MGDVDEVDVVDLELRRAGVEAADLQQVREQRLEPVELGLQQLRRARGDRVEAATEAAELTGQLSEQRLQVREPVDGQGGPAGQAALEQLDERGHGLGATADLGELAEQALERRHDALDVHRLQRRRQCLELGGVGSGDAGTDAVEGSLELGDQLGERGRQLGRECTGERVQVQPVEAELALLDLLEHRLLGDRRGCGAGAGLGGLLGLDALLGLAHLRRLAGPLGLAELLLGLAQVLAGLLALGRGRAVRRGARGLGAAARDGHAAEGEGQGDGAGDDPVPEHA